MTKIKNLSLFKHALDHRLTVTVAILFLFCVISDYFFASSMIFNSDMVQTYNELIATKSGNFVLHGWSLATDNFYLTDLPFYVVAQWFFGTSPSLIYLVPYCVFILFMVACLLIVYVSGNTSTQRGCGAIAVLVLLGLPFAAEQSLLLQSAVHGAAITVSLFGLLTAQKLFSQPRPKHFFLLIPFGLIVFCLAGSDPQVDAYFLGPLLVLVLVRTWLYHSFRLAEWLLFACVVICSALGIWFIDEISRHGGFQLSANYSLDFVPSMMAAFNNLLSLIRAMLMSFDARPFVLHGLVGNRLIAWTRFITLLAVFALCARALWRTPVSSEQGFVQWLLLGAICLCAADVMSEIFANLVADSPPGMPVDAVRYMLPAYIYFSLAAVVEGQSFFSALESERLRKGAALIAFVLVVAFTVGASQAAVRDVKRPVRLYTEPQYALTRWLRSQGLSYGLSDYWTAQMVTALSRGGIDVESVITDGIRFMPFRWVGSTSGLDHHRPAQFVVLSKGNIFGVTLKVATASFGPPSEIDLVGPYQVLIFKHSN